jgi:predicted ATPase
MPFLGTSASLVMVERDTELTSLQHALAEAADGRRQVVLVKGEAGVGKSRLAREAMRQGVSGNFEIVVGTCSERDLAFPFAPFVDAFRQRLTSSSEDPTAFLGQQAAVLAELLPEYS